MEQCVDWVEELIQIVQSKPALYDKRLKEHSDRNIVAKLWDEVSEAMEEQWEDFTSTEKSIKSKEIQQRWRNLRTCFKRELNNQAREKCGQPRNKRRKYIYFDQLLFLLPTLSDPDTANETAPCKSDPEDQRGLQDESASPHQVPQRSDKRKKASSYEESLLNLPKEKKSEEIDEDKTFLLSLVPLFKKLTDEQKLEAKLEFLRVLKRIKYSAD